MSSDVATSIRKEAVRRGADGRAARALAVQLLGPLTILGGIVWAVAQPYRIVLLEREGKGLYDYLFQPPLLVICVGLLFTFAIAPGLVEDLEVVEAHAPEG
jgi:hypothetical protein